LLLLLHSTSTTMASAHSAGYQPNFVLTPQQQNLLFRALTSNQPNGGSTSNNGLSLSPESLTQSPAPNGLSESGTQESPLLDFDYDFGPDSSFDFDFANGNDTLNGDLPGSDADGDDNGDGTKASTPENDNAEKRSLDEEGDEGREEGSAKRRESEGKVPKKPGRKPLTNEPSSVSIACFTQYGNRQCPHY
jgi:AP-1-like transcription factor